MNLQSLWRDWLLGRPDEHTPIDVHEVPIPILALPAGLEGLRIAVVSDLHFGRFVREAYTQHVIRLTHQQRPDLIVLPGDIINHLGQHARPCAAVLRQLHAPLGVLACLGNHDHFAGWRTVTHAMREAGVDVLQNEHRRLRTASGAELIVAGVDDWKHGKPDLDAAFTGVDGQLPVILLAHNPDQAENISGGYRIDLTICGHTHGGQITLLGRPMVTRVRHRKYWRGLVQGPHGLVYTSRGVGMVGLPVRVGSRPEIPILRLQRAE